MQPLRRRDAEEDAEKMGDWVMRPEPDIVDPQLDQLTEKIIGACIEVHRHLGPGLNESLYEVALCHEFELRGIGHQRQVELPVVYKGKSIGKCFIDLLVEGKVIVELKSCESLSSVHRAQLICYLQITNLTIGLLINFNVAVLKDGVKRVIRSG